MKIRLVLWFGIVFPFWLSAQQTLADSLALVIDKKFSGTQKVDEYNTVALQYKTKDFATAESLSNKAIFWAEKEKYPDGKAIAYRNLGIVATNQSQLETAHAYFKKALSYTKNLKIQGQIYGSIGRTYSESSAFDKCLEYQFKALEAFETIGDLQLQYITLYNVANTYLQMGDATRYKTYKDKALEVKTQMESQQKEVPKTLIPLTAGPIIAHESKKAKKEWDTLFYAQKIKEATLAKNDPEKAEALLKQGRIYLEQKNTTAALKRLQEALSLVKTSPNLPTVALIEKHLGDAYFQKYTQDASSKTLQTALSFYLKAFEKMKNQKRNIDAVDTCAKIAGVYEKLGNFQKAYDYAQLRSQFNDAIFNAKTKATLKNLEDRYIIAQKSRELRLKALELENKKKEQQLLYGGIIVLFLGGFFLVFQNYQRKKTNKKLRQLNQELDQANKVKTRFFNILNHDLRAPVSNLIHFLHLQKEHPELMDEATKTRLENKTITGAEDLLHSMEDILLWSKGQMEQFKPQTSQVNLAELFADTRKVFSGYSHIQFKYTIPEQLHLHTDENCLKTIVRNLTSNAINAFVQAEDAQITWSAWQDEHGVCLRIEDNGPGATEEQFRALFDAAAPVGTKSGLGLHLIRDLAQLIQCTIEVQSTPGKGTTISLRWK